MDYKFQVNLNGIIALLSNNLYSGQQVFLRELLQNAVDAIRARQSEVGPWAPAGDVEGRIDIEVVRDAAASGRPTLAFQDDGIGLTEDEVHRFLATIGASSKRDELGAAREQFIGQFGIGLLSCFMVADEIVMVTRSARPGAAGGVEWRGRPDGTYSIRPLSADVAPGTRVYLRCKPGSEALFESARVEELARHFGGLLPEPVYLRDGHGVRRRINGGPPPWRVAGSAAERRAAMLEYGREVFQQDFFDCVPLRSDAGGVEGVAFVLPYNPSPAARGRHRVYLKGMLLSDGAEGVLPDWAFFVRCVVNARSLRPTASRESFYEDAALADAREALGRCLREYLVGLAEREPDRLRELIALHDMSIKALAVHDLDFYRLFADWLPFETSSGAMTLGEYRRDNPVVRFAPTNDQFRQIARVAAAQGLCVVNAGHSYERELLARLPDAFPGTGVEAVDASALSQTFEELTVRERDACFDLVRVADRVLQRFRCGAEVRKFRPAELATLYSTAKDASFFRAAQQAQEVSDAHWSGLIGDLTAPARGSPYARLYFNHNNPLVRRLAALPDGPLLRHSVEMLYLQALLLGHHPLTATEMSLMNDGLLGLIGSALERPGDTIMPV